MSHELKTPLTAISGYSELIENRMAEGEAAVRFAKEIHHSSNRLLTLINDVIHLSELDSMQLEETKEMVDSTRLPDHVSLCYNYKQRNIK